jgi:hypothetical protein
MIRFILTFIFCIQMFIGFGQFELQTIPTDTSSIEVVKNDTYIIRTETYTFKDSIHYVCYFLEDSILHQEGWYNKDRNMIGKWSNYAPSGVWLNTINYDQGTWEYNKSLYPFQTLLDSMKLKADSILEEVYGKAFFKNNIRFKFSGYTYLGEWETYLDGKFWMQKKHLGRWDEPISEKPNTFVLDYGFCLDEQHFYRDKIRVSLDSLGRLVLEDCEIDFEHKKKSRHERFEITFNSAFELCRNNGLVQIDSLKVKSTLCCPYINKNIGYGDFYFEILQHYDHKVLGDCSKPCILVDYYHVWRIDPWTSKIILNKKMKTEGHLNGGCIVRSKLMDLDE